MPVAAVLHRHHALAGKHVLRVAVKGHLAAGPAEVVIRPLILAMPAGRVIRVHFHQAHRVYCYGQCLYLFYLFRISPNQVCYRDFTATLTLPLEGEGI